jgi:hypothetical protein
VFVFKFPLLSFITNSLSLCFSLHLMYLSNKITNLEEVMYTLPGKVFPLPATYCQLIESEKSNRTTRMKTKQKNEETWIASMQ